MKLSDSDTAKFLELETSLHKKPTSADAAAALLGDDFVEFGSSGNIWDKSAIVASLRRDIVDEGITVRNFAARELAPGLVLVTYVSMDAKKGGGGAGAISALRSSLWKEREGSWQMIFHQGTKISASPTSK